MTCNHEPNEREQIAPDDPEQFQRFVEAARELGADTPEFAEAAGRGKRLVAAEVPEAQVERAVEIMDRFESGGGGEERGAGREGSVPVVEEELSVGKRRVATGGVRVTSRVVERPV